MEECQDAFVPLSSAIDSFFVAAFPAIAAGEADGNVELAVEAAQAMDFGLPENEAFLLVKSGTVDSVVGLIFGHVDNAAACRQVTGALAEQGIGAFACVPAIGGNLDADP